MSIPIRKEGKIVGEVKGKTYYTTRSPKNVFRMFMSVNISEDVLLDLKQLKVDNIEITYKDENKTLIYTVGVDEFLRGQTYEYNGDKQRCVKLRKLKRKDAGENTLLRKYVEVS
ncbi:hypothetical protein JW968_05275 [Candidatus Woesearchaeota archaeon]|nr:hypothetical protein [Candidatus Woesearchaeota archaeon]